MSDTPPSRSARLAWTAVVVIILGVVGLVTYALTHTSSPTAPAAAATTAPAILSAVSTVPVAAFDSVGVTADGTTLTPPVVPSGPTPLSSGGRPEVLFVGAEYCPFCAAERWPLVVALSRFGRFTVLHDATSSSQSLFPDTSTFSFDGTSYSSAYLDFTGVELYSDQVGADGTYTRIARLTPAQAALVARYGAPTTAAGVGASPFVDVAGRLVATTSGFSPALLAGMSQSQIASALTAPPDPSAPVGTREAPPVGAAVLATANQLSAGICAATDQRPAAVCRSRGVRVAAAALGLPVAPPAG